jgi:hypothetical protein
MASSIALAGPAHADICTYPGVGWGANVLLGRGGFCDYPTEINGSHMHCEAGGFGLGGSGSLNGDNGSLGIGGSGVGGASCTWRCPDNTLAPAPNPPGAWHTYLVPKPTACAEHMDPAGFPSEPVRADEGGEVPTP